METVTSLNTVSICYKELNHNFQIMTVYLKKYGEKLAVKNKEKMEIIKEVLKKLLLYFKRIHKP